MFDPMSKKKWSSYMRKNDAVFLHHIQDAIIQVETYADDLSYAQFSGDRLVQDGVIRQLEIIGEACRNLSDELRAQHPDVPWRQIIGLRNRLIHAYANISLGIIWDIVQVDIPPLKAEVTRLLE
jgi:uncharacterized protein with HEPN domain